MLLSNSLSSTYLIKKGSTIETLSNVMNMRDLELLTGEKNSQSDPVLIVDMSVEVEVPNMSYYMHLPTYNNFLDLWTVNCIVLSTLHCNAGSGFT